MNSSHQPYTDTIDAAKKFVSALDLAPRNEFIFFDRDNDRVLELSEKSPGSVAFREPPYFEYDRYAEDLILKLARWLESIPSYIAPRGRGYLFGGIVPRGEGEEFVSIAPVDFI